MKRAAVAIVIVLAIGARARADIKPAPPTSVVVEVGAASGGTASVVLHNTDAVGSATLTALRPAGSCPATVTLMQPALPLTVPASGMTSIGYSCGSSPAFGLHRCDYAVTGELAGETDPFDLAVFAIACEVTNGETTGGTTYLVGDPTSLVLGGAGAMTGTVTLTGHGPTAIHALDLAIAGPDAAAFAIVDPCGLQPGCTAAVSLADGGQLPITIACTQLTPGSYSAQLVAVGETGASLTPPIAVSCTVPVAAPASTPAIAVSTNRVIASAELASAEQAIRTLVISNVGSATLQISGLQVVSASMAWTASPLGTTCMQLPCTIAPGASLSVLLTFSPTALGSSPGQLIIASNDPANLQFPVNLVGSAHGATLALGTTRGTPAIDLGTVAIGSTATATFELDNTGDETPTIPLALTGETAPFTAPTSVALAPPFTTVTVSCKPASTATETAQLAVSGSGLVKSADLAIALTCTGSTGDLLASPAAIALGEVRIGAPPPLMTVTLTTNDAAGVTLGEPFPTAAVDAVSVGALSRTTITPGNPATFTVTVDPSVIESLDGDIELIATVGGVQKVFDIPVSGTAQTASVTVPAVVNLGTFCVNTTPTPVLTTLRASSGGRVTLPTTPLLATAPSPFGLAVLEPRAFPATLLGGGAAQVLLSTTAQTAPGQASDKLIWSDDVDAGGAVTTEVDVAFIAGGAGVEPGFIDFGQVEVNTVAPTQPVTIINCGTTPLTIGAVTIPSPFTIANVPSSAIPAQGTVTLQIGFAPTASGTFFQQMRIDTLAGQPLTVDLQGATSAGPPKPPPNMGSGTDKRASLYACSCGGAPSPTSGLAIAIALLIVMFRRGRPSGSP